MEVNIDMVMSVIMAIVMIVLDSGAGQWARTVSSALAH